jgi:hypothetical protein
MDEKIALLSVGITSYGSIEGNGRNQGTQFPVMLGDFVPTDHVCRVIDAFVEKLEMSEPATLCSKLEVGNGQGDAPHACLRQCLTPSLMQRCDGEASCRLAVLPGQRDWMGERIRTATRG